MLTAINKRRIVEIQEVRVENPKVKTFIFHDRFCARAKPGQFVMVWIPGVDEIPMSLSSMKLNGLCSITVARVGEATEALHKREVGEVIGVRGPYGNGFTLVRGRVMVVGGGTGLTPLVPLVERLGEVGANITFLVGAKSGDELLLIDRIKKALAKIRGKLVVTTEDGSVGVRGLVTDEVEKILERESFDMIYTCGPEKMMYKVFLLAEKYDTPMQASLERFMKCAIGVCGSCVVGRFRVCRDGPVFSREQLREMRGEFGYFRREADGRKVPL